MLDREKKHILLIEHDHMFRSSFASALTQAGYLITEAHHGKDGWKKIQDMKPDMVILEILVPKMHGFEILRRIRNKPWGATLPVLVLTHLGDPADREIVKHFSVDIFFVKAHTSHAAVIDQVQHILSRNKV